MTMAGILITVWARMARMVTITARSIFAWSVVGVLVAVPGRIYTLAGSLIMARIVVATTGIVQTFLQAIVLAKNVVL
jgi:hypothetical protein